MYKLFPKFLLAGAEPVSIHDLKRLKENSYLLKNEPRRRSIYSLFLFGFPFGVDLLEPPVIFLFEPLTFGGWSPVGGIISTSSSRLK